MRQNTALTVRLDYYDVVRDRFGWAVAAEVGVIVIV